MSSSQTHCLSRIHTRCSVIINKVFFFLRSHFLMHPFFYISHSMLYSAHSTTRECAGRGRQLHHSSLHVERSKPSVHQRHQPGLQGDPSFCCPLVFKATTKKITVCVAQFISLTPQWQLHSTYWHFLPGDWDGRCALWSLFSAFFSFFSSSL